jgi:DNA-binding response OmpR family regulator
MPLNILVVDDHADTLDLLPRVLEKWGHYCVVAKSVAKATILASEARFNVVLCDFELPDGNCCNVIRNIRAIYPIHGVAMTGHEDQEHQEMALGAGYSDYLIKPLNLPVLREALEAVASKKVG